MDDLESRLICLNQFIRPEIHIPMKGYGNCLKCEYNKIENEKCLGYQPIPVWYINVRYNVPDTFGIKYNNTIRGDEIRKDEPN